MSPKLKTSRIASRLLDKLFLKSQLTILQQIFTKHQNSHKNISFVDFLPPNNRKSKTSPQIQSRSHRRNANPAKSELQSQSCKNDIVVALTTIQNKEIASISLCQMYFHTPFRYCKRWPVLHSGELRSIIVSMCQFAPFPVV